MENIPSADYNFFVLFFFQLNMLNWCYVINSPEDNLKFIWSLHELFRKKCRYLNRSKKSSFTTGFFSFLFQKFEKYISFLICQCYYVQRIFSWQRKIKKLRKSVILNFIEAVLNVDCKRNVMGLVKYSVNVEWSCLIQIWSSIETCKRLRSHKNLVNCSEVDSFWFS